MENMEIHNQEKAIHVYRAANSTIKQQEDRGKNSQEEPCSNITSAKGPTFNWIRMWSNNVPWHYKKKKIEQLALN